MCIWPVNIMHNKTSDKSPNLQNILYHFNLQIIITGLSQVIMGPSKPTILIPFQHQPTLSIYCHLGTGFLASCIYNMLIVIACCYYAFRARKVPSNFNESKFIAFSVYSTLVV